ncbi:MAG: cell division ATP-binding protein FtsE [Clostridiales bacterium]|nr:MAG: cell division ATP-binding protein FtsE [Clostridiales bacterium]
MLDLKDVELRYSTGNVALQNLNLHIGEGEFVYIIGSSGAGKSSLIKLLTKELSPTKGKIFFEGKDITRLHKRLIPEYRRKIGIVFQDYRLLDKATVFENIAFAMKITGKSRNFIKNNVSLLANLVGLNGREKHCPFQLSGGEQQRVSIARAIANNPKLVICDEPTGNLDPETSWGLMDLLYKLNKHGTTILMATHDHEIVNAMRQRVVMLENGIIVRDDVKGGYGV